MGFLFQNCSGGGGSGTGNGGGSASGPPPEISVNAFPGQTADDLTITDESHPDGLEVSGKCDPKEHGQEVTLKAVGDDEDNPVVKTTECNAPDWSVTLERDDLDDLQGVNMKALFTASVQSKKGVTGTSQPQALFVEPVVEAVVQDIGGQEFSILLEDVFEIKGVCRLVLVGNVTPSGALLFEYLWVFSGVDNLDNRMARVTINSGAYSLSGVVESTFDSISEPEAFDPQGAFTSTLTVTVPRGSTEPRRYGIGRGGRWGRTQKAYSYCKATAP